MRLLHEKFLEIGARNQQIFYCQSRNDSNFDKQARSINVYGKIFRSQRNQQIFLFVGVADDSNLDKQARIINICDYYVKNF